MVTDGASSPAWSIRVPEKKKWNAVGHILDFIIYLKTNADGRKRSDDIVVLGVLRDYC